MDMKGGGSVCWGDMKEGEREGRDGEIKMHL